MGSTVAVAAGSKRRTRGALASEPNRWVSAIVSICALEASSAIVSIYAVMVVTMKVVMEAVTRVIVLALIFGSERVYFGASRGGAQATVSKWSWRL